MNSDQNLHLVIITTFLLQITHHENKWTNSDKLKNLIKITYKLQELSISPLNTRGKSKTINIFSAFKKNDQNTEVSRSSFSFVKIQTKHQHNLVKPLLDTRAFTSSKGSARPLVREVPSSMFGDMISFLQLLSFLFSFDEL